MRPIQIITRPAMEPHVCIKCGSGPKNRDHFLDLGVDSVLHNSDHTGQHHITDGVIYLCSDCVRDLITTYLSKLFRFQAAQDDSRKAAGMNNSEALLIQQKEIEHLNGVIKDRDKTIAELSRVEMPEVTKDKEQTAAELAAELLGADEDDGPESIDGEREVIKRSDPEPTGTVKDDDGDNSADESSLTSSDLHDLSLGFGAIRVSD